SSGGSYSLGQRRAHFVGVEVNLRFRLIGRSRWLILHGCGLVTHAGSWRGLLGGLFELLHLLPERLRISSDRRWSLRLRHGSGLLQDQNNGHTRGYERGNANDAVQLDLHGSSRSVGRNRQARHHGIERWERKSDCRSPGERVILRSHGEFVEIVINPVSW